MSDTYEDDDEIEEAENQRKRIEVDAADWRATRKKAKDYDATAKERDEARQQLAIYDAGLTSLTQKQRAALLRTHEGEFTAEALKETAVELGFWKPPEETDEAEEDAGAIQRMSEATAGTQPAGAQNERQRILQELDPTQLNEEEFWAKAQSLGVAK